MKPTSILILFFALLITAAQANISAPPEPRKGNITGDSYLSQMQVKHESLYINFEDVCNDGTVHVSAGYSIFIPKTLYNIKLVFIANNLTESRYKVTVDDAFTNGYLTKYDTIPQNWLPPDSIQFLNLNIPFQYKTEGLITFIIDSLPAGNHYLNVDYDATTSTWFTGNYITQVHQFVYILKPTDDWKSFEDVRITAANIPHGWDFTSNLNFEKQGCFYLGEWDVLPAPYLTIAIHKQAGYIPYYVDWFMYSTLGIAFILILIWQYRFARWRVERLKNRAYQVLNTLVVAILADIYFFYIYFESRDLYSSWTEGQLNPSIRHGEGYIILLFPVLGFFIWLFLFFADLLFVYLVRRRLRRL